MATVLIYSDPHLGLQRKANFTAASSLAREAYVRVLLSEFLESKAHDKALCLGDFFDKEHNQESVILAGVELAKKTDLILAGNHDVANREGVVSSLEVIRELYKERVVIEDPRCEQIGSTLFCLAPHTLTQAEYDKSIQTLCEKASRFNGYRVLCLHCSYNSPFELPESSLNLTEEKARVLLGYFHFVFIGHEHIPASHFDGRLQIIGSFYPTSFDDIRSQHRIIFFDTETGLISEEEIKFKSWSGKSSEFLPGHYEYVTLIDDMDPGLTQRIALSLFADGTFGVKIITKAASETGAIQTRKVSSLPETIIEDLTKNFPDLVSYWTEMTT